MPRTGAARPGLRLFHLPEIFARYLRHLFLTGEHLYALYATRHNLTFYLDMMRKIRDAIDFGIFGNWFGLMEKGEDPFPWSRKL